MTTKKPAKKTARKLSDLSDKEKLKFLQKELDALIAKMNTPKARAATKELFDTTSEELGEAAVKGTKKHLKTYHLSAEWELKAETPAAAKKQFMLLLKEYEDAVEIEEQEVTEPNINLAAWNGSVDI